MTVGQKCIWFNFWANLTYAEVALGLCCNSHCVRFTEMKWRTDSHYHRAVERTESNDTQLPNSHMKYNTFVMSDRDGRLFIRLYAYCILVYCFGCTASSSLRKGQNLIKYYIGFCFNAMQCNVMWHLFMDIRVCCDPFVNTIHEMMVVAFGHWIDRAISFWALSFFTRVNPMGSGNRYRHDNKWVHKEVG